jgi:hypothetical protein
VNICWHWGAGLGHSREGRIPRLVSTQAKGKERCTRMIILGLLVVVLDVVALVNIIASSMSVAGKLLWALIVLLLPIVGMLLYFAVGHKA